MEKSLVSFRLAAVEAAGSWRTLEPFVVAAYRKQKRGDMEAANPRRASKRRPTKANYAQGCGCAVVLLGIGIFILLWLLSRL